MTAQSQLNARRAIEALRAGVPSRDAVLELGTGEHQIEERFRAALAAARAAAPDGRNPAGFLVAGNFGTGKSHLLEYLQQIGLHETFVVSKIIISKETPLYDPIKLFRSAVRSASVPGRVGAALAQVASELEFSSPRYADFYRWVQEPTNVNQRFAATVYLHEYARHDPELIERVISFWSGDPIQVGDLNRALRELGKATMYSFDRITVAELAYQRFAFAAQLMLSAGYAGWILLFDEVDLVGRYSLLQRAKSYAQIARWTGNLQGESYPGITSVMAITSAFEEDTLNGKNDREIVPGKLGASTREADQRLAREAERGIRLIDSRTMLTLSTPSERTIEETYERVRGIHARAYNWDPPPISGRVEHASSTRMREYVRSWINEWDLRRLYPDYQPSIQVATINFVNEEDEQLTSAPDGDPETVDRFA